MKDHIITNTPTTPAACHRGSNNLCKSVLLLLMLFSASVAIAQTGDKTIAVNTDPAQPTNTFCPVMPDMKVNPEIYSDYKGKRVWFCCTTCRSTFDRNPEKYLVLLPQFGGSIENAPHNDTHVHGSITARFIEPLGITTLTLLMLTFLAGIFRRKAPKLLFTWHKRLAFATVISAIAHAIMVFITN